MSLILTLSSTASFY